MFNARNVLLTKSMSLRWSNNMEVWRGGEAEPPAARGDGSLGADPPTLQRFYSLFSKKYTF